MKKWKIFLGGVIIGVILAFSGSILFVKISDYISNNDNSSPIENEVNLPKYEKFDLPIGYTEETSFIVIDVLQNNSAFVRGRLKDGTLTGNVYYLQGDFSHSEYYKGQILKSKHQIPIVGNYGYMTVDGGYNSLPKLDKSAFN